MRDEAEKWGRIQVKDSLSFTSISRIIISNLGIFKKKGNLTQFRFENRWLQSREQIGEKMENRIISYVLHLGHALPSFIDQINTIVCGKPFLLPELSLITFFFLNSNSIFFSFHSDNAPLIHNFTTRLVSEGRKVEGRISHLSFQAQLQERLISCSGLAGWTPRK